ncbi:aldo/keto reductase [Pseudonocardia sp. MH-G8]|uniref:aldo/keto reductase n=1 Tax=Pseudonocardia sp. MH-G8 TaxID=1854588 RepID=UPI000BA12099|nr:aldo/keto reductase [Pseudonocardia sp. MH-G8]OZM77552.1 aldo/keto reductase [Pseudonocardia sp. MH-G8]
MRTRLLGRTGIRVSPFCLGTMMFGAAGNADHDECVAMVHRALDSGINIVDTADVYSGSESEVILGKALKGRRDDVVLATKGNGRMGGDPNRVGSSRRWITTAVEDSLRRLQVDHIDLYQIHHPDPDTDVEETLGALTDLLRSGKVRAIGASNSTATEIVEAQWTSERRGLARYRTEQPPYSILNRAIERDVLPTCQSYGLGTLVWGPLSMGLLTGKYRKGHTIQNARMRWVPRHLTDAHTLDVVERLLALADEVGTPLTRLAMAFTIAHPAVTSAIIGPRTPAQLEDLLAGADTVLGEDVLDQLDVIAPPGADIGLLDVSPSPLAVSEVARRRRPVEERAAA